MSCDPLSGDVWVIHGKDGTGKASNGPPAHPCYSFLTIEKKYDLLLIGPLIDLRLCGTTVLSDRSNQKIGLPFYTHKTGVGVQRSDRQWGQCKLLLRKA